jgi:hypothetical protein
MTNKNSCSPTVAQAGYWQQQLCLNLAPPRKPQISSIPGIPAKERNRYRVTLNGEILADKLTLDEALKLAGGKR